VGGSKWGCEIATVNKHGEIRPQEEPNESNQPDTPSASREPGFFLQNNKCWPIPMDISGNGL
jgi:hypothetical protein